MLVQHSFNIFKKFRLKRYLNYLFWFQDLSKLRLFVVLRRAIKCVLLSLLEIPLNLRILPVPSSALSGRLTDVVNGQIEALAHVAVDYAHKSDILELRKKVPYATVAPRIAPKRPFVPRPNPKWPPYRKALFCAEWLRDHGNVDSNEVYAKEVLLPLIGSMHDGELTADEAEECFLEAVCGGERYGSPGRGMAFFKKQFKSHLGSRSSGHRTLGSLIGFCKSLGMKLPWTNEVSWEDSFQKQFKNYQSLKQ
jgi:hypothetical protein